VGAQQRRVVGSERQPTDREGEVRTPHAGLQLSTKYASPLLYTDSCSAIFRFTAACAAHSGVTIVLPLLIPEGATPADLFGATDVLPGQDWLDKETLVSLCSRNAAE
jgi:hypothetical protein